jgi:hypothetical protein
MLIGTLSQSNSRILNHHSSGTATPARNARRVTTSAEPLCRRKGILPTAAPANKKPS